MEEINIVGNKFKLKIKSSICANSGRIIMKG